MELEIINKLYLELSQVATAKTGNDRILMDALREANELLRSANSIAYRDGKDTNWEAFRKRLTETLNKQHQIVYPASDPTRIVCLKFLEAPKPPPPLPMPAVAPHHLSPVVPNAPWAPDLEIFPRSRKEWWVRFTGYDGIYRWLNPISKQWVEETNQIDMPMFANYTDAKNAADKSPEPPTWQKFLKEQTHV